MLGHFIKLESCNFWNYFSRLLICLAAVIAFNKLQSMNFLGAKGAAFQLIHMEILLFLLTLAALILFSGMLHETRQGGILGLLMMTGVPVNKFLISTYSGKFIQLITILLLQIPFCLFSVTLGGVKTEQILFLYFFLLCWLFMVSAIYSYAGAVYSNKKEALIVNSGITVCILILFPTFDLLPFRRVYDILFNRNMIGFISHREIIYVFIGSIICYRNLKGFEKFINSPKAFISKSKNTRRKNLLRSGENPILVQVLNKKLKLKIKSPSSAILDKDLYLYPQSSLLPFQQFFAGDDSTRYIIIGTFAFMFSVMFITLMGLLNFLFVFVGIALAFTLFRSWIRLINNIKYELDENTFISLMSLPIRTGDLLQEKLKGCQVYDKTFYILYIIHLITVIIMWLDRMTHLPPELVVAVLCLPLLKSVIEKLTLVFLFTNKDSAVFTSASVAIFIMTFYFTSLGLAGYILFLSHFALKSFLIKLVEKYGSTV